MLKITIFVDLLDRRTGLVCLLIDRVLYLFCLLNPDCDDKSYKNCLLYIGN